MKIPNYKACVRASPVIRTMLRNLGICVAFNGYETCYIPGKVGRNWGVFRIVGKFLVDKPETNYTEHLTIVLHEISHWLVATPYQRRRENYGIPEKFDTTSRAWLIEFKVRYVEKYLSVRLGMPYNTGISSSRYYAGLQKEQHSAANYWWKKIGRLEIEPLVDALVQEHRLSVFVSK